MEVRGESQGRDARKSEIDDTPAVHPEKESPAMIIKVRNTLTRARFDAFELLAGAIAAGAIGVIGLAIYSNAGSGAIELNKDEWVCVAAGGAKHPPGEGECTLYRRVK